jgi:hypothetical protein
MGKEARMSTKEAQRYGVAQGFGFLRFLFPCAFDHQVHQKFKLIEAVLI